MKGLEKVLLAMLPLMLLTSRVNGEWVKAVARNEVFEDVLAFSYAGDILFAGSLGGGVAVHGFWVNLGQ